MKKEISYIISPRADQRKEVKKIDDFITVVLLSENHGYRMKSYGPISLLKINGKSLIEKQIEAVSETLTNFEIIVCCGFETYRTVSFIKSKFSHLNIRVVENQIHYNSNCCESARLCLSNTSNDRILFCNGAILLKPEHLATLDFSNTSLVTQDNNKGSNLEIGVVDNNSILENLSYGVKHKYWSEIFYITNHPQINEFYSILSNPDYKNKFMFEAINELSKKYKVYTFPTLTSPITKIDNIKTIKEINK